MVKAAPSASVLFFAAFQFDPVNQCVWREGVMLPLTPKAFAVLHSLITQPARLVTKEGLLQTVWPGIRVGEAVLKVCVGEIRKALGDDAKTPQFIETVYRRGYRWIAPLTTTPPVQSSEFRVQDRQSPISNPQSAIVGREAELAQLHQWWEKALSGERQIVFVTGEAGIGKTALVDVFLAQLQTEENHKADAATRRYGDMGIEGRSPRLPFPASPRRHAAPPPLIARGQCVEHYGAGEAYLPMLAALGRLCRAPGGEQLIALLRQQAPTWLVQMPALLGPAEREALQREVLGATRERMLREMAEALEVVAAEQALVLVLEDLHWSDHATLELVAFLGRRWERARLFIVGTYRPVDVIMRGHALRGVKQELALHKQCVEVALENLSAGAVTTYLAARFSVPARASVVSPFPRLAAVLRRRTGGNPLFMVNVVDSLVAQGVVVEREGQWELSGAIKAVESGVPETIRQQIEQQIERLSPQEQQVLEAASVAGVEFSVTAVAAGLAAEGEEVEQCCEGLARRGQFLRSLELREEPSGAPTGRYGFIHALYPQVLYQRLSALRRTRLHRRIGESEEQTYGSRAGEIAAELAVHFAQGQDGERAARYLQQAADTALHRSAYHEAVQHLSQGLTLLQRLPDTPERARQELQLQILLGVSLSETQGYTAVEVERAYTRARALCQHVEQIPQLFSVWFGLSRFHFVRGELPAARELGEQLLGLARHADDPTLLPVAHSATGAIWFYLGEFLPAQAATEQGVARYQNLQSPASFLSVYGEDPGAVCLSYAARTLQMLGYPDQAWAKNQAALALAQELVHPLCLGFAKTFTAFLHQHRREAGATRTQAEELIALSHRQEWVPYWPSVATILRGWALSEQRQGKEGIAQIRQGMSAYRATGSEIRVPYFLALLAEAYGKAGQTQKGLSALAEALTVVEQTGERWYEAELWRLTGELTQQQFQVASSKFQGRSSKFKVQSSNSKVFNPQSTIHNPQLAEAEACFHKAIEIARRQSAKFLELRAAVSVSRLWQSQGKQKQAHKLLADIYSWFTEGFDTADLQEAKALLKALG